jgi:hypothetical protein
MTLMSVFFVAKKKSGVERSRNAFDPGEPSFLFCFVWERNMATTLQKIEEAHGLRTVDDSSDDRWLVRRRGNNNLRMPVPCVSCAQSVKHGPPIGYDPAVELGGLFQNRGNSDVRESFGDLPHPVPYMTHRCPYANDGPCTCRDRYNHRMFLTSSACLVAIVALVGLTSCKRR